ncbi:ASN_collapsed_G0029540.mRNA.1.CDS.1 [Saccharomyces cerevisiae]|nr:ASN_collapsed_G0029540.mRNA.1.CDS.1 [Saccharomyces cerevisiae]
MSLPAHLQQTFSPEEIQFIVENEPIKIFPRITTRQKFVAMIEELETTPAGNLLLQMTKL